MDINDPNNHVDETLQYAGNSKEWLRQNLREDKFEEQKFKGKVKITDAQIEEYYPKHINCCWCVPEKVKISLIKIDSDKEKQQDARTKADALLEQINAGADFAELAAKNSDDYYSSLKGGDCGYYERGRRSELFDKIVFALEPNEVSKVFTIEDANDIDYYIVKRTGEKIPARTKSLEEVRDVIYERLEAEAVRRMLMEYLIALKEDATVVYLMDTNDIVLPYVK
jgi:peptidyl-prolyl cis-trans isomerase D